MKRSVLITIDDFVHDKAKEKGLNISRVCEDTLREVIGSFDRTIEPSTCEHNWAFPFSAPFGLAKQCKRCGMIKRIYVQGTSRALLNNIKICWASGKDVNEEALIKIASKDWGISKKQVIELIDKLELQKDLKRAVLFKEHILIKV